MGTTSLRAVRTVLIAGLLVLIAIPAVALWHAFGPGRHPVAENFRLVDQSGRQFDLAQERGRPVVLFFGYTHCPDVCPTTLANLAHARSALGAAGRDTAVLFVTVDPHRDTPPVLKRYVALFDPSFVGLTGSQSQLAPVYSAYHVYHEIQPAADSASGYLVTHSAAVYFVGRDGRVRDVGDWTDSRAELTRDLQEITS